MADLTGPFDTAAWSQSEWYNFAPAWAPSGIIGSPAASVSAGDFAVTTSGLNVTVACNGDRAWIDGSGYKPDTDKTLPVTANGNASLSRRDRIVIRRDLAAKTIAVVRLAGTPASGTPAPPALTQVTGGVFDAPICSFLVPPNNGTTLTGFIDERVWINPDGGDRSNAGTSGVLAGTAPPAGMSLLIKTFYASVTLNANGDGTVTFPGGAFPNGLLTIHANHYSAGSPPSNDLEFVPWNATLGATSLRCYGPTGAVFGGTGVPVVVTAIGW